ncbi:cytochrome c oxidase subunit VIIc [Sphaeroforma arctica JP610]|uniref:Cytochrome c oxidase subunit VIIc n=1 Tax=Sphaeroforma arctica JP610 TaxID=667725 RepID=A0A0L0FUU8_9EUKA|nr:cytochrome c oxidase subunit VIIc [Sphaeroforma arctica JP610]KNC80592.1 cytochrome c oxidase subunit VIIc [Sphaeroforma arctica JP610]|eukprot:XP_014154494.1 cytochrome c oxidase subunit VIIc [Sphaeroforma arctica JP610]
MSALRVLGSRLTTASQGQTLARATRRIAGSSDVNSVLRATGKFPDGRPVGCALPFQILNKPRMAITLIVCSTISFAVPFIAIEFQKYKANR